MVLRESFRPSTNSLRGSLDRGAGVALAAMSEPRAESPATGAAAGRAAGEPVCEWVPACDEDADREARQSHITPPASSSAPTSVIRRELRRIIEKAIAREETRGRGERSRFHETEVGLGEATEVWEDDGQVGRTDAEPPR